MVVDILLDVGRWDVRRRWGELGIRDVCDAGHWQRQSSLEEREPSIADGQVGYDDDNYEP